MNDQPKSIPRDEQETTITFMRDDKTVSVFTSNRPHLDRLRKLANTEPSSEYVKEIKGTETYGDFTVEIANFRLFSAIRKPRVMSAEQRAAAAGRLRAIREGK
ncbi:hypothetical protein [Microbacterium maritypicum]